MALRFGLQIPSFSFPTRPRDNVFAVTRDIASEAEAAGFDSLWLMDHLFQVPIVAPSTAPILDCWTALAGLATTTRRLRLGTLVSAVGHRPPSMLAKMTSTLDVMCEGRLIVGLGAGWAEHEHRAYGLDFPPIGVRLARLEEELRILIAMWTEEHPAFEGRHFRIDGALNFPRPVRRPHPPILIGGSGARVTLRLAAQYAQIHNIAIGGPEECVRVLGLLREHCERIGRDPAEIEKSRLTPVLILESEADAERRVAALCPEDETLDGFRARTLVGTPERLAEQLQAFVDVGIETFITSFWDVDEIEPLHTFIDQVVPLLKPRSSA